ncbi:C39 family peptidase [Kitasatospora sp. NPDC056138]|uniref:C39 family peptidase n=1 Tax=Kitasatospora sp. NPDC056138 TaxID=3345724 RepID=UPI0035E1BBEE
MESDRNTRQRTRRLRHPEPGSHRPLPQAPTPDDAAVPSSTLPSPAVPSPARSDQGARSVLARLLGSRRSRLATALAVVLASAVMTGGAARSDTASSDVPQYQQQLGNDCEAAALRMVLAARGVLVGDQDVLARIGTDLVHYQAGVSGPQAGDPFRAFVGDADGSEAAGTGFGVYYPPVAQAAQSYGLSLDAAGQGISPDRLRAEVSAGHPAVVWVDYNWRSLAASSYTAYDGRQVPYAGPSEHSVVVAAVGDGQVLVNDPARGQSWMSDATFDAGYATYGNMAVIVE